MESQFPSGWHVAGLQSKHISRKNNVQGIDKQIRQGISGVKKIHVRASILGFIHILDGHIL